MPQHWYNKNIISYLLLPFSFCYRLIISIRRFFYQCGIFKVHSFPVPIIVVGNITVGGTGKTPLVIAIAQMLKQQGWQPGIVSRGYGGQASEYPQWVTDKSSPQQVGDESVLIALKTQCPVVVDPKRVRAIQALLANTACNIVISDDGLQHYAMGRNIEIAVIDGTRWLGNGFCLPAGPLREPKSKLDKVNMIVINNGNNETGHISKQAQSTCYPMQLEPGPIYNLLNREQILSPLHNSTNIYAVAAIGNPQRFFNTLRQLGYAFQEKIFPDHYAYQASNLAFKEPQLLIMTEKDAVKCQTFATEDYWCLPVFAVLTNSFWTELFRCLNSK